MVRRQVSTIVGLLLVVALSGCADRLVDAPTERRSAVIVALGSSARCPSDTVLLTDDDPASGAGAIPSGFDGRTLLQCEVDYTTMRSHGDTDLFTVTQWRAPMTADLRAALDLPDREFRWGGSGCSASTGSTTALYAVDAQQRAVRVVAPTDQPCQAIREELRALLPDLGSTAVDTYQVSRKTP